jgi:serine phosphatase RsbU (regulator of sigma subunit)
LSDGIPEQMNSNEEMYDYPRFKEKFHQIADKNPQEIIDTFIDTIDEWRGETPQDDDFSLMVIKVK